MSGPRIFFRMVASTNDLGSGFPTYAVPQRTITVDGSAARMAAR
jgi:hypothetical protein